IPAEEEEQEREGFGDKVLGFAKKAGLVAGGVVAAPVALAAYGVKEAVDKLRAESPADDQTSYEDKHESVPKDQHVEEFMSTTPEEEREEFVEQQRSESAHHEIDSGL